MTDELRIEVERSRQLHALGEIWQREAGQDVNPGRPPTVETVPDGLRMAIERVGAERERGAVVKWLRGLEQIWRDLEAEGAGSREERAARSMLAENYRVISAAIERGAHGGGE